MYHRRITRLLSIGAAIAILTLTIAGAVRLAAAHGGLQATYYANADWRPPAARVLRDPQIATDQIAADWDGAPPAALSATWEGWFTILHAGAYRFRVAANGSCVLAVDGTRILDCSSEFGVGTVRLDRGRHELFVQYARAGAPRIEVAWARGDASPTPISSSRLFPRKPAPFESTALALLPAALGAGEWIWIGWLLLVCAVALTGGARRVQRRLRPHEDWRAFRWILAGSLALNIAGVWWGLPGLWPPGELRPVDVVNALSRHFSHGWSDVYPPLQFYLLSLPLSPLLLLWHWGRIDFASVNSLAILLTRLVSIVQAAVIVAATFVSARIAFGRRAGLFGAGIIALTATFVYYAKTANVDVPYVCWFALSMVWYLRLLTRGATRDFVLFGLCAALAVGTKDQAYGLYALLPFVIVFEIWRANRKGGLVRAIVDSRLWAGGAAAAVAFAVVHNLAFNADGFAAHVRFIAGDGSQPYRVFEPTWAGRTDLWLSTLSLTQQSLGWPMTVAALAGVVLALVRPSTRRTAVWLLAPVVSYYVTFINVILYNYDRFMLPVCVVLAIFGGLAFDALVSLPRAKRLVTGAVAAAFAYSLLYAAAVDYLMIRDSRYEVVEWLHAHVRPGDVVGVSGNAEYNPVFDGLATDTVSSVEALQRIRPAYVVVNADYLRAVSPVTDWRQLFDALQHGGTGYTLAKRFRTPLAWAWIPGGRRDLVGPRQDTIVLTTLRNINPTIEVYEREPF